MRTKRPFAVCLGTGVSLAPRRWWLRALVRRFRSKCILDFGNKIGGEATLLGMAVDVFRAVRFVHTVELVASGIGVMPDVSTCLVMADTGKKPATIGPNDTQNRLTVRIPNNGRTHRLVSDALPSAQYEKESEAEIASAARSDASTVDEMHMIGIYEPMQRRLRDGRVERADVPVIINRPAKTVTLVLGTYEPVRWVLHATDGTTVARVIVGGHGAARSEVFLNGERREVEQGEMPLAYQREGVRFQPFHAAASKLSGVTNADSFVGAYEAPETGFSITSAPGVPTLDEARKELLEEARDRSSLSLHLQTVLSGEVSATGAGWKFRSSGFEGVNEFGEEVRYETPLELPEISWPSGVAYDPEHKRLWGVAFGGEGFLYEYDILRDQWSAWSMRNIDAGGLLFDTASGTLVASVGSIRISGYAIMDRQANVIFSVNIPARDYPGLIDYYDPGNGPSPTLVPIAIEGYELLVQARARFPSTNVLGKFPVYLVNLRDGSVELIR